MDLRGAGHRPWQLGAAGRRRFDRALATGLLLPSLAMLVVGVDPMSIVLSLVQVLPLYWRRTRPAAVFAAVASAHAMQVPLLGPRIWGQIAFPIAIYSVARFSTARAALVAVATGIVASAVASVDWLLGFLAPEVTVQRFLGGVVGVAFAWVGVQAMVEPVIADAPFVLPWLQLALVVLVSGAAGLLAGVLPARRAARTAPAAGLAVD